MAWDTITDAEVDANSPLNTTLFTKQRDNQNALAINSCLFSAGSYELLTVDTPMSTESIADDSGYENVVLFVGIVWIPEFVDDLKVRLLHRFAAGAYDFKNAKADVDNDAGGWTEGSDTTPPQGAAAVYDADTSTITDIVNPGRWADLRIQAKQKSGGAEVYYLRAVSVVTKTIVP